MVRTYQKKNTPKPKYTEDDVAKALMDIAEGKTIRKVSKKYNIPKTTLLNRYHGKIKSPRKIGRKTAILRSEEMAIALNLARLGDYGMALDSKDLQNFVKYYLDSNGRSINCFACNMPGIEWVRGFLKRHENILTTRMCQNISRKRAAISANIVEEFFKNLKMTLDGVPPSNIVNYDETNLVDDPKGKVQIFRRGTKYAERIMNTSKSTVSIMFAVTATGNILPPYVVYKAERMQDSWVVDGPADARYNRTTTGWFDSTVFLNWFNSIFMVYVKALPSIEPKVLIGDNLPSHINYKVMELCEQNNVRMCFLPPNSTHLLQPLDVAVFGPLKMVWNNVLSTWKLGEGKHFTVLPKNQMPKLLLSLMEQMDSKWEPLAVAGFQTCGIYPYDPTQVLKKITKETTHPEDPTLVSPTLIKYLQEQKETSVAVKRKRGRHVKVCAGQSISLNDLLDAGPSSQPDPPVKKLHLYRDNETDNSNTLNEEFLPCDYVLVEYLPKVFYLCRLIEKEASDMWKVEYYRHVDSTQKTGINLRAFKLPDNPDIGNILECKFIMKCKLQTVSRNKLYFKNDFGKRVIR